MIFGMKRRCVEVQRCRTGIRAEKCTCPDSGSAGLSKGDTSLLGSKQPKGRALLVTERRVQLPTDQHRRALPSIGEVSSRTRGGAGGCSQNPVFLFSLPWGKSAEVAE